MAFDEFLEILLGQIEQADGSMQLRQRAAWNSLIAEHPMLEGIDRFENLGLSEITLVLCLEPYQHGFFGRLWRWLRALFGLVDPPRLRLAPRQDANTQIIVTVRAGRMPDGHWAVSSEPSLESTGTNVDRIVA